MNTEFSFWGELSLNFSVVHKRRYFEKCLSGSKKVSGVQFCFVYFASTEERFPISSNGKAWFIDCCFHFDIWEENEHEVVGIKFKQD